MISPHDFDYTQIHPAFVMVPVVKAKDLHHFVHHKPYKYLGDKDPYDYSDVPLITDYNDRYVRIECTLEAYKAAIDWCEVEEVMFDRRQKNYYTNEMLENAAHKVKLLNKQVDLIRALYHAFYPQYDYILIDKGE